jgi:uncharacterized protein (TIGR00369 family)
MYSAEELERIAREEVPYVGLLGLKFERIEPGEIIVRLPFRDDMIRPGGTISGPVMRGVADYALYALVLTRQPDALQSVTTNLTANFLRRPKPVDLLFEGKLLKIGRRLAVGEVTIFSAGDEEPVCHITGTYSISAG